MPPGACSRSRGSLRMRQGLSMLALAVALVAFCGRPASVHAQPFVDRLTVDVPEPSSRVVAPGPAPRNLDLRISAFPTRAAGIRIAQGRGASGN